MGLFEAVAIGAILAAGHVAVLLLAGVAETESDGVQIDSPSRLVVKADLTGDGPAPAMPIIRSGSRLTGVERPVRSATRLRTAPRTINRMTGGPGAPRSRPEQQHRVFEFGDPAQDGG
jgi:hypothetical protein